MVTSRIEDRLDPTAAALIVIDVQNDFCAPDGQLNRRGVDVGDAGAAADALEQLIPVARGTGIPVVFVRTEHDDTVDSAVWRRRRDGTAVADPHAVNCRTGSWGAEFFLVQPVDGEAVIAKHRYSAFTVPAFRAALRSTGRMSLLFAGVATDVCVESTLRDAVDDDYLVSILSDCCAAYDRAEHAAAIRRVTRHFGPCVDSAFAAQAWQTT